VYFFDVTALSNGQAFYDYVASLNGLYQNKI